MTSTLGNKIGWGNRLTLRAILLSSHRSVYKQPREGRARQVCGTEESRDRKRGTVRRESREWLGDARCEARGRKGICLVNWEGASGQEERS